MSHALLVIDVQNDFTEGGALGVAGGQAVAIGITEYLRANSGRYAAVFASRDWHNDSGNNGGHFSHTPDYKDTWPVHCVAGTLGAEYHPKLDTSLIDIHVQKGQGIPAYSIFEGTTQDGTPLPLALKQHGITEVDIVGIATDHCVRASALDALSAGLQVTILEDLVAPVDYSRGEAAKKEIVSAGGVISQSVRHKLVQVTP